VLLIFLYILKKVGLIHGGARNNILVCVCEDKIINKFQVGSYIYMKGKVKFVLDLITSHKEFIKHLKDKHWLNSCLWELNIGSYIFSITLTENPLE